MCGLVRATIVDTAGQHVADATHNVYALALGKRGCITKFVSPFIHYDVLRFDQAYSRNLFIYSKSRALLVHYCLLLVAFHSRATNSKYFARSLSTKIR